MPESAPLDVERLRRTFEDDSVLAELYALYVDDTAKRLAELREAVSEGDFDRCRRTGHTLKGSSSNIGAGTMSELAAQIERAAAQNGGTQTPGLIDALEDEFQRAERFINEFVARVNS